MKRVIAGAGAVLALTAVAACGNGTPAQVRVHGSFGWSIASHCSESELQGAQVTVTDASGKVLATAVLPEQGKQTKVAGLDVWEFPYSVTVPTETRYGVSVAGITPYYVTQAQFEKGIDLSC